MSEFDNNTQNYNDSDTSKNSIYDSELTRPVTSDNSNSIYGNNASTDTQQQTSYSQQQSYSNASQGQQQSYSNASQGQQAYNRTPNYRSYQSQNQYNNAGANAYRNPYQQQPPHATPSNNNKSGGLKGLKLAGAAVAFGVIAGITMFGVNAIGSHFTSSDSTVKIEETEPSTGKKNSGSSNSSATDISAIVEEVMPSVVSITSTVETSSYFGYTTESSGAGSGFIIEQTDDKLMIATNNHVVADSKSLTVAFIDKETAAAEIVGTDSTGDLAVISVKLSDVKEDTLKQIKKATLGDSDSVKVGDTVIAIGNALGYGQSVTTGVLSAKDREVSMTDGTMILLQTDAAINPGNSGGVLINTSGEVIGINNAKLADTEVEGMGYAIPISTAKTTLNDIMENGSVKESDLAYLGVVGKTIDETYSAGLGIPSGAYVSQVVSGSPAEEAGIQAGDVIVKLDDTDITSMEGLKSKLNLKKAGTTVKITVQRSNKNGNYSKKELKVKLGKRGDYQDATTENENNEEQQQNNNSQSGGGRGYTDPYEYFFGSGSEDSFNQFFGR